MAKLDKGKWAEKQAADVLERYSLQSQEFAWHRFPDARAAQGALAAQPSDFLICYIPFGISKETVFLEVKETAQERRLPKAKLSQYGTLLKFHWAGARVVVLVFMSQFNHWVILEADDLFEFEECPPSFPLHHKETYASASDAMKEIFQ